MEQWMGFQRKRRLKLAWIAELGFMDYEMANSNTYVVDRFSYQVKRVLFLKYYELSEPGCYLASSMKIGGLDTFWSFQFHTLSVRELGIEHLNTSIGSVKLLSVLKPRTFGF